METKHSNQNEELFQKVDFRVLLLYQSEEVSYRTTSFKMYMNQIGVLYFSTVLVEIYTNSWFHI